MRTFVSSLLALALSLTAQSAFAAPDAEDTSATRPNARRTPGASPLRLSHRAFTDQSAVNAGLSDCLTRHKADAANVQLQVVVDSRGVAESVKAVRSAGPRAVVSCMESVVKTAGYARGHGRSAFRLQYALSFR